MLRSKSARWLICLLLVTLMLQPTVPATGRQAVSLEVTDLRGGDGTVYARASYDYVPSVMKDGVYKMWWCGGVAGDFILYAESSNPSGPWHARGSGTTNSYNVALRPRNGTDAFDNLHTCDPSVVRVNGTYYMYYGALKARTGSRIEPTTIGVASSRDGLSWTRLNSGRPILVPARDVNTPGLPSTYGAGQPSAVFLDGKFYLTYTDTTGYAGDGNGGGQYVIRSSDPTFQSGVEELTATGFAPRTAATLTRHKLVNSVSVDWQYSDLLQAFLVGIHSGQGRTSFRVFDRSLQNEIAPAFTVSANWREGPGIASRPDKHALPSGTCGAIPVDYLHAIGTTTSTWNLAHRGFTLRTGLTCGESRLPEVFDGFRLTSAGLPLATVFGGRRIQWALAAPVGHLSRNSVGVSSDVYHSIPYEGSVHAGQQVLGATGRPAAFKIGSRLWPVDCLEAITANRSSITVIPAAEWDAYPKGASLRCLR